VAHSVFVTERYEIARIVWTKKPAPVDRRSKLTFGKLLLRSCTVFQRALANGLW